MMNFHVPNVTLDQLIARAERGSTKLNVFTTERADTRWIAYRRDGDTPRTILVSNDNGLFTYTGVAGTEPQEVLRRYGELNTRREDYVTNHAMVWANVFGFCAGALTYVGTRLLFPGLLSPVDEGELIMGDMFPHAVAFGVGSIPGMILGVSYGHGRIKGMISQKKEIAEHDAFVREHDIRTGLDAYLHLV